MRTTPEKPVAIDSVTDPNGNVFDVSTTRTIAGGAPDYQPLGRPFKASDYADETPWPFETMIFKAGTRRGLYHAAYVTREEALSGHARMVLTVKEGLEFGGGVQGAFGNPSLTPAEWQARLATA